MAFDKPAIAKQKTAANLGAVGGLAKAKNKFVKMISEKTEIEFESDNVDLEVVKLKKEGTSKKRGTFFGYKAAPKQVALIEHERDDDTRPTVRRLAGGFTCAFGEDGQASGVLQRIVASGRDVQVQTDDDERAAMEAELSRLRLRTAELECEIARRDKEEKDGMEQQDSQKALGLHMQKADSVDSYRNKESMKLQRKSNALENAMRNNEIDLSDAKSAFGIDSSWPILVLHHSVQALAAMQRARQDNSELDFPLLLFCKPGERLRVGDGQGSDVSMLKVVKTMSASLVWCTLEASEEGMLELQMNSSFGTNGSTAGTIEEESEEDDAPLTIQQKPVSNQKRKTRFHGYSRESVTSDGSPTSPSTSQRSPSAPKAKPRVVLVNGQAVSNLGRVQLQHLDVLSFTDSGTSFTVILPAEAIDKMKENEVLSNSPSSTARKTMVGFSAGRATIRHSVAQSGNAVRPSVFQKGAVRPSVFQKGRFSVAPSKKAKIRASNRQSELCSWDESGNDGSMTYQSADSLRVLFDSMVVNQNLLCNGPGELEPQKHSYLVALLDRIWEGMTGYESEQNHLHLALTNSTLQHAVLDIANRSGYEIVERVLGICDDLMIQLGEANEIVHFLQPRVNVDIVPPLKVPPPEDEEAVAKYEEAKADGVLVSHLELKVLWGVWHFATSKMALKTADDAALWMRSILGIGVVVADGRDVMVWTIDEFESRMDWMTALQSKYEVRETSEKDFDIERGDAGRDLLRHPAENPFQPLSMQSIRHLTQGTLDGQSSGKKLKELEKQLRTMRFQAAQREKELLIEKEMHAATTEELRTAQGGRVNQCALAFSHTLLWQMSKGDPEFQSVASDFTNQLTISLAHPTNDGKDGKENAVPTEIVCLSDSLAGLVGKWRDQNAKRDRELAHLKSRSLNMYGNPPPEKSSNVLADEAAQLHIKELKQRILELMQEKNVLQDNLSSLSALVEEMHHRSQRNDLLTARNPDASFRRAAAAVQVWRSEVEIPLRRELMRYKGQAYVDPQIPPQSASSGLYSDIGPSPWSAESGLYGDIGPPPWSAESGASTESNMWKTLPQSSMIVSKDVL